MWEMGVEISVVQEQALSKVRGVGQGEMVGETEGMGAAGGVLPGGVHD